MATVYNLEGYNTFVMQASLLDEQNPSYYDLSAWGYYDTLFLPVKSIPADAYNRVEWDKVFESKSPTDKDKTVYIHPNCKVSRSFITQKYKKSLNPWFADKVVIPDLDDNDRVYLEKNVAIFINDKVNSIFLFVARKPDHIERFQVLFANAPASSLFSISQTDCIEQIARPDFSTKDFLDAKLDYYGSVLQANKKQHYLLDIVAGVLPKDKLVFEKDIVATLGNADNAPTFESLISIRDMLNSSDDEVVGSAIKALASMDYMNYPNSVKYVLDKSCNWRWNKACNTTAAKYMFKQILGGSPRKSIWFRDTFISEKDYNLFEQLVKEFEQSDTDALQFLKWCDFTYEDENFGVHPRIAHS